MTNKIELLLSDLEHNIQFCHQQNLKISKSNVGWHIEHSLLTLDRIIDRLSQSDSTKYKWSLNFSKIFVLTTKKIPRGRAQSPKSVRPVGDINPDTLSQHLRLTNQKVKGLALMKPVQFFEHPYFGHLKLRQAIKFLEIHSRHHLKIIEDIKS